MSEFDIVVEYDQSRIEYVARDDSGLEIDRLCYWDFEHPRFSGSWETEDVRRIFLKRLDERSLANGERRLLEFPDYSKESHGSVRIFRNTDEYIHDDNVAVEVHRADPFSMTTEKHLIPLRVFLDRTGLSDVVDVCGCSHPRTNSVKHEETEVIRPTSAKPHLLVEVCAEAVRAIKKSNMLLDEGIEAIRVLVAENDALKAENNRLRQGL